eukprot:209126-Rhodomonas_salina.1
MPDAVYPGPAGEFSAVGLKPHDRNGDERPHSTELRGQGGVVQAIHHRVRSREAGSRRSQDILSRV